MDLKVNFDNFVNLKENKVILEVATMNFKPVKR